MCSPGWSPQMDIAFPLKPNVAAPVDYSKRRHQPEKDDLELNPAGEALLAYIEESARPKELAAAFPRIVNHMAKLWKIPREMNRYFEELLTDIRFRTAGGVHFGMPMPRKAPSTQFTPSSLNVGVSGSSGWRLSIATASARILPLLLIAKAV